MGAALGLIAAIVLGHVAIAAIPAALTGVASIPIWVDLGDGAVQLIQLDAKIIKALAAKQRRKMKTGTLAQRRMGDNTSIRLCFQGAPSGQAARFCS